MKISPFSNATVQSRWKIVTFPGQERDYLLRFSSCIEPDCPCRDMTFTFSLLDDPDDVDAEFAVTLNVDTWRETKAISRSEPAASCVREFETGLTDEMKTELRGLFEEVKKHGRLMSEFIIDAAEIEKGTLIPYSEVAGDAGSILKGGQNVWMTFPFEGTDYLVEDLYCLNPSCRCREVHLVFLEASLASNGSKRIRDAFEARMTLRGRVEVTETFATNLSRARTILEDWMKREDRLSVLRARYKEMKDVGRRGLAAEVDRLLDEDMPHEPPPAPIQAPPKIGRNEPCPCGSGRKYKKCCGK